MHNYVQQIKYNTGCNFSFQCNKFKKKFLFKQERVKEIVIVPITGQVL